MFLVWFLNKLNACVLNILWSIWGYAGERWYQAGLVFSHIAHCRSRKCKQKLVLSYCISLNDHSINIVIRLYDFENLSHALSFDSFKVLTLQ